MIKRTPFKLPPEVAQRFPFAAAEIPTIGDDGYAKLIRKFGDVPDGLSSL
jgi:hypothetical protein